MSKPKIILDYLFQLLGDGSIMILCILLILLKKNNTLKTILISLSFQQIKHIKFEWVCNNLRHFTLLSKKLIISNFKWSTYLSISY